MPSVATWLYRPTKILCVIASSASNCEHMTFGTEGLGVPTKAQESTNVSRTEHSRDFSRWNVAEYLSLPVTTRCAESCGRVGLVGYPVMVHSIQNEIDELIGMQIKAFGREGALSEPELQQCLERFSRIKQLCRDLDHVEHRPQAPWIEFS